ncbi:MAG: hypothetical protein CVU89_07935 [Firmicutes bacterium HGW-Firmicutes-14]|nr:MAG: hypothetical protein CVU89_07935 [Firmicutes bacterium HGW-Firmicutes-14]
MNIICFSSTRWDFLFQRPQQLTTLFSENFRVGYINPPSVVSEIPPSNIIFEKFVKTVNPNLIVFAPPRLRTMTVSRVREHFTGLIREFIKRFGLENPLLWINLPEAGYMCGNLGERLVVYDCLDDYSSFSWTPEYTTTADRTLARKADIVLVVSEPLYASKSRENSNCFLIPNACDFEHFSRSFEQGLTAPDDIKRLGRPRIGFIGAIYEWVDLDLVSHLAREEPGWSIVLVGPKHRSVNIPNLSNIHWLGRRPYNTLPNYLQEFDVCIIPFKNSETALNSSPIKLYEYLASGKPIVSTPIPEVIKFGRLVERASDKNLFLEKVRLLLTEPEDEKDRRCRFQLSVARVNTWESRYRSLKELVKK